MIQVSTTKHGEPARWDTGSRGIDRATGLPNRAALEDYLGALDESCGPLTVMVVHVSGAATIRSRYGSADADRLVQRAGRTISRCTRPGAQVARLGEDDLVVVLEETHLEDALRLARRINHEAERANAHLSPDDPPLFLAVGAAEGPAFMAFDLLEAADPWAANGPLPEVGPEILAADEPEGPSVA